MARGKRTKKMNAKTKKLIVLAVVVAVVAVALFLGFFIFAKAVNDEEKIFPNVYVSGVKVGGMTREEALSTLDAADVDVSQDIEIDVVLTDEVTINVTGDEVDYANDLESAVDMAFSCGRSGGLFKNTISYIRCLSRSSDVADLERNVNSEKIKAIVSEHAQKVNDSEDQKAYEIEDDKIIITKGIAAYIVDEEAVCKYIEDIFKAGKGGYYTTEEFSKTAAAQTSGTDFDLDALYEEIYAEAADATYDYVTATYVPHVIGVDFDLGAAKTAYNYAKDGDVIEIELIITEPEILSEDLEGAIFRDVLAEKTTSMSTSSSNRINNIALAAAAIDGLVMNPGDEFSFNGVVGERTSAKGYKSAGAYVGGESVDQIGGGICQVSSTIYYCTLKAGLEITNRANHMFTVAYLPLGMDATVNWGTIDFKFKNNQEYPIKINATVENKSLTVQIMGTKLDDQYIELEYELLETIPYEEVQQVDETLAKGETKVKTSGHLGYVVNSYSLLYDGEGNLISREFIAKSTYRKQDRVILISPEDEIKEPGEETGGETDPVDPDPVDPDPVDPDPVDPDPVDPDPVDPDPVDPDPVDPDPVDPDPVDPDPVDPDTGGETGDAESPAA